MQRSANLQTGQGAAKATPAARHGFASISAKRDLFASLAADDGRTSVFRPTQGGREQTDLPLALIHCNAVASRRYGRPAFARPSAMR
jgi:hypothetical protein